MQRSYDPEIKTCIRSLFWEDAGWLSVEIVAIPGNPYLCLYYPTTVLPVHIYKSKEWMRSGSTFSWAALQRF